MLEGVLEGILFVCGDDGISKDRLLEILEINSEELDNLLEQYASKDVILKAKSDFIPYSDFIASNNISTDFIPY